MLGTTEILIIAAVVLVIFGGAAIPKFARSLGKARKEFEDGVKEGSRDSVAAKAVDDKKVEKKV